MTTPSERWLLDTNVWVFGLRRDGAFPACTELLERIGTFSIVIPLQLAHVSLSSFRPVFGYHAPHESAKH